MDHDLLTFMERRPATDFAFGIVDDRGAPRASFLLEWISVRPGTGTWVIQFAQGPGADPVDQATFQALSEFGAWLGLDCVPLAG